MSPTTKNTCSISNLQSRLEAEYKKLEKMHPDLMSYDRIVRRIP
jgi:hypothetical protein